MRLAFFLGCKIPYYLAHYETATRAICRDLDIELAEVEFNCCGYPMRHQDFSAFLLASARNLALAEKAGLDILTPCKCCFGSLKIAASILAENAPLQEMISGQLRAEGLIYSGQVKVEHILTLLSRRVGEEKIKAKVFKPLKGLKVAALYGCHALRPSAITQFDDPLKPSLFDRLVELTGATSLDWPGRLSCCGEPLREKNDQLSLDIGRQRIKEAKEAGADYMCIACTHSQLQMELVLARMARENGKEMVVGSILYPQLLGLALGLEPNTLGLGQERYRIDVNLLFSLLARPEEEKEEPKKARPKAVKKDEEDES